MKRYTPVAGTNDWAFPDTVHGRWWKCESEFTQIMYDNGWNRRGWSWHGTEIPAWTTKLAGTFFAGRDSLAWERGAFDLAEKLEQLPVEERNLVGHSHGGNIAVKTANLLAPYGGINRLVTVCTPRRRSMASEYACVSCPWLHVYSTHVWKNSMQWMGARGASWKMPGPAKNLKCSGIGHSELLRNPSEHLETVRAVIEFLNPRGEPRIFMPYNGSTDYLERIAEGGK